MRDLSSILVKGFKGVTTKGSAYEVLEYKNYRECVVINYKGIELTVPPYSVVTGSFKDPTHPSVHGVGFIGIGKYLCWDKQTKKKTKEYSLWSSVLMRCYDERIHKDKPTYRECTVCEEWHNFQNFAKWCNEQPNFGCKGYHLDKDLILFNNKVYCPEMCSFVPSQINCLFSKYIYEDKVVGVNNYDKDKGWAMEVLAPVFDSVSGKTNRTLVKYTKSEEDAYATYKYYKEKHVKDVAEYYKSVIDKRIYDNLLSWTLCDNTFNK